MNPMSNFTEEKSETKRFSSSSSSSSWFRSEFVPKIAPDDARASFDVFFPERTSS
jgi:hypothetical protein